MIFSSNYLVKSWYSRIFMKTHVFYYRIPYSNGKYHKNRLVLARETELLYFFAESSRYINGKSLKDMYETPRKKCAGSWGPRIHAAARFLIFSDENLNICRRTFCWAREMKTVIPRSQSTYTAECRPPIRS